MTMNTKFKVATKEIEPPSFWLSNNRVGDGGDHWVDNQSGLPLAFIRSADQAIMRLIPEGTLPPRAWKEYDEFYLEKYCLPSTTQEVAPFYFDEMPTSRLRWEAWEQGWWKNVKEWPEDTSGAIYVEYGSALNYAVHVSARLPTEAEIARAVEGMQDIAPLMQYEHDDYLREKMKERHRKRRREALDGSNLFGLRFMEADTWTSTTAIEYLEIAGHMTEAERVKLRDKFKESLFRRGFKHVFLAEPTRTINVRFALTPIFG